MDGADGAPPPIPAVPAAAPDLQSALFDTRLGTKEFPTTLAAGGSIVIDGDRTGDGGTAVEPAIWALLLLGAIGGRKSFRRRQAPALA